MVKPSLRSRTYRRIKAVTPGGKKKLQYKKRKPAKAICASCGDLLHGVPRERPYMIRKLSKTERRPERPFGGVLCSKCMRLKIIASARGSNV
jgi:large subunit ribosomal protein L34e